LTRSFLSDYVLIVMIARNILFPSNVCVTPRLSVCRRAMWAISLVGECQHRWLAGRGPGSILPPQGSGSGKRWCWEGGGGGFISLECCAYFRRRGVIAIGSTPPETC